MKVNLPASTVTQLDLVRGVAAVAVLIGHIRGMFFVNYDKLAHPTISLKALYFITGLSHQAVVVFFVLSGFFVGTSVLSSRKNWSWRNYLLRRLTRLYVVLIPALFMTGALDLFGMHVFGAVHNVYSGHIQAPLLTLNDVRVTLTPLNFTANLLFLQSIFSPSFGSNGALWSLSYELWAYILFPLGIRILAKRTGATVRGLYVSLAAAIVFCGGTRFFYYFALWLLGAAVAASWHLLPTVRRPGARRALGLCVGGVFGLAILLTRVRFFSPLGDDFVLGLATAALVLGLLVLGRSSAADPRAKRTSAYTRAFGWFAGTLASFSYTLYLIHLPILTFIHAGVIGSWSLWVADPWHIALGALIALAATVAVAYPMARMTERRTEEVRSRLAQALGVQSRRALQEVPK